MMWFSKQVYSGLKEERTWKGSEGNKRESGIVWNMIQNILICQIREIQIPLDVYNVWNVFLLKWKCLAVWAFWITKNAIGFLFMFHPYLLSSKVLLFWYQVMKCDDNILLSQTKWNPVGGIYTPHLCFSQTQLLILRITLHQR